MIARLVLTFPGRPPTHNAERRRHWAAGSSLTADYRLAARLQALGAHPIRPPFEVHAQPVTRTNVRADAGACFDVVKAVVDGCKDAGVIPDDGPDLMKCVHLHAPERGDRDELLVELVELPKERPCDDPTPTT